jgi:Ca2+-binding RTX toxin-like protein
MGILNEVETGLIGLPGLNGAITLPGEAFTAELTQGAGTFFPMAGTVTVQASIGAVGDQDYFAVQLTAGETWIVDVDVAGAGIDLTLYLYDPLGNLAVTVTDGAGIDPGSASLADPYGAFVATSFGLWRIGFQAALGGATGAYTVHVSRPDQPLDVFGTAGADAVFGGIRDDTLRGYARDAASADTGADSLVGGGGRDRIEGVGGDDTLRGETGNDTLLGGNGADSLLGGDHSDRLVGGAGNDTLFGDDLTGLSGARDTLSGGAGDDLLQGVYGADLLQGGEGADTLLGGEAGDRLQGGAGNDVLYANESSVASADAPDLLDGGLGDDTLAAGAEDRVLAGEGNDLIVLSLAGGGYGIGFVDGGAGEDTAQLLGVGVLSGLSVSLDGSGMLRGSLSFGVPVSTQPLRAVGIERLYVQGSDGSDDLRGGALADTLIGFGGVGDQLAGGAGNDSILAGGGIVTENALLLGEDGDDFLRLGVGDGVLDGGAGNDSLEVVSSTGPTILQGGTGDDLLRVGGGVLVGGTLVDGGSGDDVLELDLSTLFHGADSESFGDGGGWIEGQFQSVDYTGIERLLLRGGTGDDTLQGGTGADTLLGGSGDDTLQGGTGADTLLGGSGNDLLSGGLGNDFYSVDSLDTVVDTGGADTVESGESHSLAAGIETLVLTGGFALNGTGNGGNNLLLGNVGANGLNGGNGADTLVGGAGADRLTGGTGNDVFVLRLDDAQGDRVMDFAGLGAAAGDVIRFEGYGAGAAVSFVSGAQWRVQGAAGFDTFLVSGSFDPLHDAIFA